MKHIIHLYFQYIKTLVHERLCNYKWYRKYIGGTWYYVYHMEDDEEYWTNLDIRIWHKVEVLIQKEEHYE